MSLQDAIAILIATAAAAYAIRAVWRTVNSGGCGGPSCACHHSAKAGDADGQKRAGLVRKPLVRPDQIGLPAAPAEKASPARQG